MTSAPVTSPAGPGDTIAGKYRLESLLGEGGMGSVWRASNLLLEVPVAIKLLRSDLAATELGERLRVEARAAAQLAHPSIVRVFDIGEAEWGDPFIVMELLVGESLGDVLQRGPLAPKAAVAMLLPIAEALSLAHSRGVVHRDLKPDNVFLAVEGSSLQPKLLDFGIAKVSSPRARGAYQTETGTLLGSPDYMSPEQAYGRTDIDERSDVWAFCVVLYEAIAGRTPFHGDSCQSLLRSIVSDPTPPLMKFADVDPALAALIESGLAKDVNARPASITLLAQQLASWLVAQGEREDVTGTSLEAKWLGRARGLPGRDDWHDQLTPPHGLLHEEATLISVVHPLPRLASVPDVEVVSSRRRGWLPTSAALMLVALAGYGLTRYQLGARPAGMAELFPAQLAAAAPAPVLTPAPVLAPPPDPSETKPISTVTTIPEVTIEAMPAVVAIETLKASAPPTTLAAVTARPLPQALPRALPARMSHSDLLNPY
jgi:serine/threonine-protein kinase